MNNSKGAQTMTRRNRSYKELTLQQVRSLCETADQGSFTAHQTRLTSPAPNPDCEAASGFRDRLRCTRQDQPR